MSNQSKIIKSAGKVENNTKYYLMTQGQANTKIEIYTDGSCLGNPGPGGWGVIILGEKNIHHATKSRSEPKGEQNERTCDEVAQCKPPSEIHLSGGESQTTNNRMEMTAIIKALEWLHKKLKKDELNYAQIIIYSDSNLLISTLNLGWKRKANLDLWAEIDRLRAWLNIEWTWVKAHATNKLNNQVDKLALAAAQKFKKILQKDD